jgi:hypothetical protein
MTANGAILDGVDAPIKHGFMFWWLFVVQKRLDKGKVISNLAILRVE